MAIKKYDATKDNTITNWFGLNISTRKTGSNMGASDILEVYSVFGQQTTSSAELSRVLIEFPISSVAADRTAGNIPASGSVNFFLRMFNARHSEQLPRDFTLNVMAVSQSWQEGTGLDMEGYSDVTEDRIEGSNWVNGTNDLNFATATLVLQGGANLASMDAQTFVLTGADGTSQTFTFEFFLLPVKKLICLIHPVRLLALFCIILKAHKKAFILKGFFQEQVSFSLRHLLLRLGGILEFLTIADISFQAPLWLQQLTI